jgi:valyl-tRNA synthetase
LANLVAEVTADFERYDCARALKIIEEFFWRFCDDYIELVKDRAYQQGPAAVSAQITLRTAISVLLQLFAPFLPYTCEEAWSWGRAQAIPAPEFDSASVHRATWPDPATLRARCASGGSGADYVAEIGLSGASAPSVLQVAAEVLRQIRKAKSDAKRSVRAEVQRVKVRDTGPRLAAVQAVLEDLRSAGNVAELVTTELPDGAQADIEVQLLESRTSTN